MLGAQIDFGQFWNNTSVFFDLYIDNGALDVLSQSETFKEVYGLLNREALSSTEQIEYISSIGLLSLLLGKAENVDVENLIYKNVNLFLSDAIAKQQHLLFRYFADMTLTYLYYHNF